MRLLSVREPLVIPAACRMLGDGDERTRLALVETLGSYGQDAAALNLLVLAFLDAAPEVRRAAGTQLAHRGDPRIGLFARRALRCEHEAIVQRGAEMLACLADASAVDDLITVLPTTGSLGHPIGTDAMFEQLQATFSEPTAVPWGGEPFKYPASIALPSYRRSLVSLKGQDRPAAGSFRSYVQDALIAITGENYGFDVAAWRDWATRHAGGP